MRRKVNIAIMAGYFTVTTAYAASNITCTGQKDTEFQQKVIPQETLFRFAVSQLGTPTTCENKVTTYEGATFGTLVYHFKDGSTYSSESLPPETSMTTLSMAHGFKNEETAIRQLKEAAKKADLNVNWEKSETDKSGKKEKKIFWDRSEGTNGRGFLSYKDGQLVSIGFGMAL